MQVLNNPDKPKVEKEEEVKLPENLCGFAFVHNGRELRLFQFEYKKFVTCLPGSYNRWSSKPIDYHSAKQDLDEQYPGWSKL